MKPLRRLLDNLKPAFSKNKFAHTVFDGLETFLFQPDYTTDKGVHIRDGMDLKRTMVHVVIAMQLCYITGTINIGHQHYLALGMFPGLLEGLLPKLAYGLMQLLPLFVIVHVVGLGIEFFFAAKKGHAIEEGFLVSGALIPLIMPPDIPLWMVAIATIFAVVIAKEAFGGTGMNVLNVALTARVFVFFAYPGEISGDACWVAYDYNILHQITNAILPGDFLQIAAGTTPVDGFSGATPLALAATGGWAAVTAQFSSFELLNGFIPGSIGEMNKIACIVGAFILIGAGIGSWRIMVSMVIGAALMGIIMNYFAATQYPGQEIFISVPWYYQFLMGSFFFAMAFMATDPVTAASTPTGKLVYGFLIGAIGMIIRVLNPAYPEGWMLAILLMNVFAPLIDHLVISANIKRRMNRAIG